MLGLARLPNWLYPITPATIGICALVVVFVGLVGDTLVTHWREDRRDQQREGED